MAPCAMSCYVIIMRHAGDSGGKELLMTLGLCVNETKGDDRVSLGVGSDEVGACEEKG